MDVLDNKNIIKKTYFANQVIVNVYDNFTKEELDKLREKSRLDRLSLRDLFIAINEEH